MKERLSAAANTIVTAGRDAERMRIEARYEPLIKEDLNLAALVSYVGNRSVPILRLYRYKEAFSLEFVHRFLDYFGASPGHVVFDPFAGMGTTLFAAMVRGLSSVGVERLPIAAFVAETLPRFLDVEPGAIATSFERLKEDLENYAPAPVAEDVPLMSLAFDQGTLLRLRQWKAAIDTLDSPLKDVLLLLFFSILQATSYTSNDGQFLRLKRDKRILQPDHALESKVLQAETDLLWVRSMWPDWGKPQNNRAKVYLADARNMQSVDFVQAPNFLITSPPYANRYDYTRSYCLELCFHFVRSFEELKQIRFGILRSHIESKVSSEETPSHPVVQEAVENLRYRPLNNPRIPHMLTGYFLDMEKTIREWSRVMAVGGRVAMVVDNVRFEGEMIPVDLVLSEIAERYGFVTEQVIIARYKGNSSQQMGRYGRTRVRESIVLWRKL